MWSRTKRLINSYLDNLIERVSGPGKEVHEVTRQEATRLNELEIQARGAARAMQKELAEIELKILGSIERVRIEQESGANPELITNLSRQIDSLSAHRDLLKKQIGEAGSSADRARQLREERLSHAKELGAQTHLTSMQETLAGVTDSFDPGDPSSTIEEMRNRLGSTRSSIDDAVASADRELASERARASIDDTLARYKESLNPTATTPGGPPNPDTRQDPPEDSIEKREKPEGGKSLGRTDGPFRPID